MIGRDNQIRNCQNVLTMSHETAAAGSALTPRLHRRRSCVHLSGHESSNLLRLLQPDTRHLQQHVRVGRDDALKRPELKQQPVRKVPDRCPAIPEACTVFAT